MAAVRPQLVDSITVMGGWEGLYQAQEVGLENFSSPFHLHLMCSRPSHRFLSWLAGLGALVFGLCCAQSHSSEHYLELLVTCVSIMAPSPWMLCLTTSWGCRLWNGKQEPHFRFCACSEQSWWGPSGHEKLQISGWISYLQSNKTRKLSASCEEGTMCLLGLGVRKGVKYNVFWHNQLTGTKPHCLLGSSLTLLLPAGGKTLSWWGQASRGCQAPWPPTPSLEGMQWPRSNIIHSMSQYAKVTNYKGQCW